MSSRRRVRWRDRLGRRAATDHGSATRRRGRSGPWQSRLSSLVARTGGKRRRQGQPRLRRLPRGLPGWVRSRPPHRRVSRGTRLPRSALAVPATSSGAVSRSSASLPPGWPHAMPKICWPSRSVSVCRIFPGARRSARQRAKGLHKAVCPLGRLEQDCAAIGTRLLLLEGRDEGLLEQVWEEDSL